MIVLTGGAGFIGSAFLWRLNEAGVSDIIVVDELGSSEKWRNLTGRKFADYIEKDDLPGLIESGSLPSPSCVVHMGACSDTTCTDARFFIKNNYEYSKILLEWALEKEAHFMYASSAATYGDGGEGYGDDEDALERLRPLNMYAFSKHLFDMWVQRKGLLGKVMGIKFFNVFGPNEYHKQDMRSVVCKAFPGVRDEGRIKLFRSYRKDLPDGEQKRDFIYIKDAVEVMYRLFTEPEIKGIFNLGSGEARSWNDLAKAMFKALDKPPRIEYIDMPDSLRPKYQYFTQADISKLEDKGIRHDFMSLESSVEDYIKNYLLSGKAL